MVKNLFRIKMVALSIDFASGEKYAIPDTELWMNFFLNKISDWGRVQLGILSFTRSCYDKICQVTGISLLRLQEESNWRFFSVVLSDWSLIGVVWARQESNILNLEICMTYKPNSYIYLDDIYNTKAVSVKSFHCLWDSSEDCLLYTPNSQVQCFIGSKVKKKKLRSIYWWAIYFVCYVHL